MRANKAGDFLRIWGGISAAVFALSGCGGPSDVFYPGSPEHDDATVRVTIATLDQTNLPAEELADLYLEDAVILRPGQPEVRGREAIVELMEAQAAGPALNMRHRIDELTRFEDIMVVEGGVTGVARPDDGSDPISFATQNLIIFKRGPSGIPKIWKVIFNSAPMGNEAGSVAAD